MKRNFAATIMSYDENIDQSPKGKFQIKIKNIYFDIFLLS